ncbi:MAG: RES family NAD+ phosphorylase [Candidatus Limnocylindria bacterium]
MLLYRVFPWLSSAAESEPGHPLHVPQRQGAGRADNAGRYSALYLSNAPAGAVAEAFGNLKLWTPRMFQRPDLPGSARALATYAIPDEAPVFDLDDAAALSALGLRPSEVVTRDRKVTQLWALRIYEQQRWAGLRWWSYYDPRWYSYAIWDVARLTVQHDIHRLAIDDPMVVEASEILRRPRRVR